MERVAVLIDKLKQQSENGAPAESLLVTAQMLVQELQHLQKADKSVSTRNVSVVFPTCNALPPKEQIEVVMVDAKPTHKSAKKEEHSGWLFDPVVEVPTLAHQNKEVFVLNDSLQDYSTNLNDALREDKVELSAVLQSSPIKDLRNAININDKFRFINELFRGDETMYERSIKTINSFGIYAEAEYWIQRELKIKLGWEEGSEVVADFDQLVKRRFA